MDETGTQALAQIVPLAEVLDCITDAVSSLDIHWRYVYANATAERLSGLNQEQLIGKSIWDLFPGLVGSDFEKHARTAMAQQQPARFEYYYAPFGKWYEQRLYPTATGLLCLTTDIDGQKRLDRRIREGEELYRHLFEVTNDGILIVDGQGRYVDVNGSYCRFLKAPRERLVGAHFREFIPPDRLEEAVAAFAGLKAGKPTPVVFPLRATDGSIVELEWSSYPHYLPDLFFCIGRNLTEARRDEAALQAAEERQRRAVEAGGVGLWEWDIERNKVTWSDRIYELHGVPRDGFAGTVEAFTELVDVRDRECVAAALAEALAGSGDYHAEFRTVRPDKRLQWLQTTGKVTFGEDGRPLMMHGAVLDTTDRRLAEELQRQVEQQLMLLVEASGALLASPHSPEVLRRIISLAQRFVDADAHAVWQRGADGWSLRSAAGLSPEYVRSAHFPMGGDPAAVLSSPWAIEDVATEPMMASRREALRREGIRSILVVPLQVHGEPAGTVVFYWKSQYRFHPSELRIASALGNLAASALGTAELYERQTQLRGEAEAAERRSRFLAEAGAALSSSLDYDRTLASVAALAVPTFADWASVEVVGENEELRRIAVVHRDPEKVRFAHELVKRYPPRDDDAAMIALRTGKPLLIEEVSDELIESRARDREHLRVLRELGLRSAIVTPIVGSGRSLGIITFVTAESERRYTGTDLQTAEELARRAATALEHARLYHESRRAEAQLQLANEELRRANEDLNQFAYSASHDLQEPLRMIKAYSELLNRRCAKQLETPDARDYLAYIIQGASRLESLLRDILTYTQTAHGSAGQLDFVDADAVLQRALANLDSSIQETLAQITFSPLPALKISEVHLLQLFQNLIGNAIKYRGPRTPEIAISARLEGTAWIFAVRDNGIGIDPDYQTGIFGLFKRLHTPDEYAGTGVGLAICQKIVDRYGGRIWVESAVGAGSTFHFTFPASMGAGS